jgi:uncharacterized protein (TIGR03435 family)
MRFETFLFLPAVQAIGWALLHFIWEGGLLAAFLFAADTLTRQRDARLRYAIGCAAMLSMPTVFVATIVRNMPYGAPAPRHFDEAPRTRQTTIAPARPGNPLAEQFTLSASPANALPGWAVCLWFAGVATLSIYTAAGWIRVERLKRRSTAPASAVCNAMLDSLMYRLRVSRPVRLYVSALAEVPTVIGWLRPYILVPISALTKLSESQLRAVLAHELAHVRRHDYLVNMLQAAIETLLFYHPAVWWVSRRIREEREHCCDDVAVAICGDAMEYAGALVELEGLRGTVPEPALAATGGDLLSRVRRLLGEDQAARLSAPAGAAIAASLVLGAAISVVHAQPAPVPKFDVVSVKPCDARSLPPGYRSGPSTVSAGGLNLECMTLRSLIITAYIDYADGRKHPGAALGRTKMAGAPGWIDTERYSINAKAEEPVSRDIMQGPMLQAVLEDRFHIKTHRETREVPVYEIAVAKSGFKLQPAVEGSCTPRDPADPGRKLEAGQKPYCGQSSFHIHGPNVTTDLRSMTLEDFSDWLMLGSDRPVVDKTGIPGKYDFHLEYAVEPGSIMYRPPVEGEAEFLPLTTALRQFGLSMTPTKGPGQFLVFDRVERPSEN